MPMGTIDQHMLIDLALRRACRMVRADKIVMDLARCPDIVTSSSSVWRILEHRLG